ncbi:MAG: SDR family NAD(P)-dependent oxidoreductase [Chloroflexota bacterium]
MSIPSLSLNGKVALVTGAKRGIGQAVALAFADAGAEVAICTRVLKDATGDLETVAEEIRRRGRRSLALQADVSRKADVDSLVQRVMDEFGVIDILVNNAGNSSQFQLLETSEDEWQKTIDAHLKSCYLCCQAVGKGMVARRSGNIVNVASVVGISTWAARGLTSTYNIAKAGMIMLTKVLAKQVGAHNVRVNAIAPGVVKTERTRGLWQGPKMVDVELAKIPLGRLATVEDIVGPVLFLASDASAYITGQTLIIDGGLMT